MQENGGGGYIVSRVRQLQQGFLSEKSSQSPPKTPCLQEVASKIQIYT